MYWPCTYEIPPSPWFEPQEGGVWELVPQDLFTWPPSAKS